MKREFLMLAQTYKDQHVGGWFASEKLDGIRAFWDGGISRGERDVPWVNTEKDVREHVATGLWSRHGKIIHAPDWWLDELPPTPLDGELYIGREQFQKTVSIVRKLEPVDDEWDYVIYTIFDCVPLEVIFKPGVIDSIHYKKIFTSGMLEDWYFPNEVPKIPRLSFKRSYERMMKIINESKHFRILTQQQLDYYDYKSQLDEMLKDILKEGGEGVVLRDPNSYWTPERSHKLLKCKPYKDDEAKVIGFEPGKGRLEGLVGALIVEWEDTQFKLSGMTDAEREWGYFDLGDTVTFKYRELSKDGVPKEARFWRKY